MYGVMKRLLLLIVAVMCVGVTRAQNLSAQADDVEIHVPTEEDVTINILPTDSPYFYMPMMQRYMQGDMTLTDEHYFYLYYGYAYQPEYDAHKELPGESVMYDIFKSGRRPDREEALALIEAGMQNMTVDPFSPSNINMMTFAYELVGDSLNARVSAHRFRGVVRAITSSGTGMREKSPWHILRFSHAADIVAQKGFEIVNTQIRSRDVEYIQVGRNSDGVRGYFFNFGRVYWKPFTGERVKKRSKWMLNGTPL